MRKLSWILLLLLLSGCAYSKDDSVNTILQRSIPEISVTSTCVYAGRLLTACASDEAPNNPPGNNLSPQVSWEYVPNASGYLLFMFDLDADYWMHWIAPNITAPNVEMGHSMGYSYMGPNPPANSGDHHYRIEVFALQTMPLIELGTFNDPNHYAMIVQALDEVGKGSNVLAHGSLTALYSHGDNLK